MWLTGWKYRKKITIDETKVDADLTDFPVLVKLTSSNFNFSKARSDGYDIRFCYSPDTEILTENGWILLKDLVEQRIKIKVATLNPETNKLEYHYPTDYQKLYFKGKLFHQKGRSVDLLVTPEHRMWIRKEWDRRKKRKFEIVRAKDLPRHYQLQVSADWDGKEEKKWFILPAVERINGWRGKEFLPAKRILMDDWLKFFGFWLAEGSVFENRHAHTITLIQKDGKYLKEFQELLKKYGLKADILRNNLRVIDIQLYSYLSQFGHAENKFIPKDIKNLSNRQLEILFEWIVKGDGHKRGRNIIYFTISRQLADDVSEIALKLGYGCSFKIRKWGTLAFDKYKRKEGYVLSLTKREVIKVNSADKREWTDYEGFVYDITVPNHIIYVRRNGKSVWSGNCSSDGETLLKYERERHDNSNQVAEYWVKIPSVSGSSDTDFYIYFGKSDASDGADPTNVWDSNFKGVWHMKDYTTSQVNDSTSNAHNSTKKAANEPIETNGKIAKAQDFDGTNDYITAPQSTDWDMGAGDFTIEFWIYREGTQRSSIWGSGSSVTAYTIWIDVNSVGTQKLGIWASSNGTSWNLINADSGGNGICSTTINQTTWYHVIYERIGTTWRVYLNGSLEKELTGISGTVYAINSTWEIGRQGSYGYLMNGLIDELRVSKGIGRSAAWIKASYNSGNDSLLSYGSEEIPVASRRLLFMQM